MALLSFTFFKRVLKFLTLVYELKFLRVDFALIMILSFRFQIDRYNWSYEKNEIHPLPNFGPFIASIS